MLKIKTNLNQPWTNQELLAELDKRIEDGKIKVDFDSKDLSSAESNSSTSLLNNKNILLFGAVLMFGLVFYYSQNKTSTSILTTVKINENK